MEKDGKEVLEERSIEEYFFHTLRATSEGAEKWVNRPIKVLDHGFVRLVDYMGNDSAIVQAARVSYGRGTKQVNEDAALIRYLMRHHHTTPFEMAEVKFHCKMPIFVARQWVRHRTANINEYSGRYSLMSKEFYVPGEEALGKQAKGNRQGRGELLTKEEAEEVRKLFEAVNKQGYAAYEKCIGMDVARELARIALPVSNYTEWYWKIDLYNLFHFLRLRMDAHAQEEIRVYANAIARIVKDAFPVAYQAFEDYELEAEHFSRIEMQFLRSKQSWPMEEDAVRKLFFKQCGSKRETEEFIEKLKWLGYLGSLT